jgi:type II secretory pathway pseudopilin PulG
MRRQHGFSIIELVVSMGLMIGITAAVFAMLNPSQGSFAVEPEVADMQQRLRVSADTLARDLMMAGSGAYSGAQSGSLGYYFAPVLPFRQGLLNDDPPGTFKSDTITLLYVPPTNSQTSISQPMPQTSAELKVNAEPGCPAADELCGFKEGDDVLIFDPNGSYDTFTITNVQEPALHLQHNMNDLSTSYAAGSKIVRMADHTYYLRTDAVNKTGQLMHYSGGNTADVPIVDDVVALQFDYYGDGKPPVRNTKPLSDATGPWTTYGPRPPDPASKPTAYPMGENCAFMLVGGNTVPRLADLSDPNNPNAMVQLTAAQFTDGPWCPDAANPNRWDADLLRIRKIGVRIRVQSANAALRGPAGILFTNAGTSKAGARYAPDQEIRFSVTPRNLNLGR